MGQGIAQAVTRDLIDDLNPRWLFLVGIGGGIPNNEYSLGDVILASRFLDFSVTAALQDKPPEFSVTGESMHVDVEALLAHMPSFEKEQLKGWNSKQKIRMAKPEVIAPPDLNVAVYYGSEDWRKDVQRSLLVNFPAAKKVRNPKVRSAPIITSNALIKDASLAKLWTQTARHVEAVEMELGGVCDAAKYGGDRDYRVLAVRGLSDIVGFKRSGDWTTYACHSAAAFAHALIVSGILETARP